MARRLHSLRSTTQTGLPARVLAVAWLALVATLIAVSARGDSPGSGSVSEYQLKAAFLERFRSFVHWPANTQATPKPAVLGIVGHNPFGANLPGGSRPAGETRALRLIVCTSTDQARTCDILFFCGADSDAVTTHLQALGSLPILTVGEGPQFTRLGGMIGLVPSDRRLRLEINLAPVSRAGLRINPDLLQLATMVEGKLP